MEAVKRARERLAKYPVLLTECHESASKYAKCVLAKSNLQKNHCEAEFSQFRICLMQAAKKNNTKL